MKLIPVDRQQCQAEKPNPHYAPFGMGGDTRRHVRCTNTPTTIATETEPNPKDGLRGKMSLCDACVEVCKQQMPDKVTFRPLRRVNPVKLQQATR